MAEKEDPVIRDLPELDKLVSEQDKKLTDCEEGLRRWRQYSDDYRALRERLSTLPQRVSHQVTVPLGPLAFAPGRLVHTNELLVLLGDNWFAKTSAHDACGIVDRRLEQCDNTLLELEKERTLFTKWREQTAAILETDKDVQEIREPLDEKAEEKWREEHRERVAAQKRREAELRRQVTEQTDVLARLDALEKLEELRDEMDRLSDDEAPDSDSDSDSDGSVIIRPSPEEAGTPLDSDDDSEPDSAAAEPPEQPGRRKRVSFSGEPGGNTVHLYDRDAPTGGGGGGGEGDGGGGGGPAPDLPGGETAPPVPPVSILKPTEGRPATPPAPAGEDRQGAAAAAAGGRARWLGAADSVPIVSAEEEEPLPPQPQRPDLSKVFSYKIEERDAAAMAGAAPAPAGAAAAGGDSAQTGAAAAAGPQRPVSRFRASRARV